MAFTLGEQNEIIDTMKSARPVIQTYTCILNTRTQAHTHTCIELNKIQCQFQWETLNDDEKTVR